MQPLVLFFVLGIILATVLVFSVGFLLGRMTCDVHKRTRQCHSLD